MPTPCERAVAEYFAALRAMDVERWVATFAPDAVSHDPVGTPPLVGHEGLRQFLTGMLGLLVKVGLTEDAVYAVGNSAAVKWTGEGTGKNGAHVRFEGIDVIECNSEGKITAVHAYWDAGPVIAAVTA